MAIRVHLPAAIRRLLSVAPGSSRLLGPPRGGRIAVSQWTVQTKVAHRFRQVHPAALLERRLPKTIDKSVRKEFLAEEQRLMSETFVLEIPNVRQCGENGEVITPEDRILSDLSSSFGDEQVLQSRLFLGRPLPIAEPTAVLAVPGGSGYFHWMLDLLPRIALLRHANQPVKRLITNPVSYGFQRETLQRLAPPASEQLPAAANRHYALRHAVLPSRPSLMGNPPRWACEFLREHFLPEHGSAEYRPARLYISRDDAGWRRVENESEIVKSLRQRGFERIVLGERTVREQAELFRRAKVIVASHGGGLTNLVFAEPGTKVLEFFPGRAVNVCYWALANIRELDYCYVVDTSDEPGKDWAAPVRCAPELLHAGLDLLGV